MAEKIVINPEFASLTDYIANAPEKFNTLGNIIHSERNMLRHDKFQNFELIIKNYRKIYLPNRFAYAHLWASKAKRAYDYAHLLLDNGFNTPRPVAYIECFKNGLLSNSFFISEYTDFQPLKTILEKPLPEADALLQKFARFTFRLHQHHIYHFDYSVGNVLFKKIDHDFHFSLVDNNRIKLRPIDFETGVKNFNKLGLPTEMLSVIGKMYAACWGVNETQGEQLTLRYHSEQLRRWNRQQAFKRHIKRLSPQRFFS